jgi:hypothetical protein
MRKRMVVAFGAAALLFAVPAMAAGNFEYKGIKLGMSLTELRAMFPNMVCDDETAKVSLCQEERGNGDASETYVFNMYGGKLARANIWFSENKYREARETLMRQFGRPSNKTDVEVAKKKAEVLTWMHSSPSGMLVIEQLTDKDPTKTNIMMNDDTLVGEMAKAK